MARGLSADILGFDWFTLKRKKIVYNFFQTQNALNGKIKYVAATLATRPPKKRENVVQVSVYKWAVTYIYELKTFKLIGFFLKVNLAFLCPLFYSSLQR